jgi:Acetyltransferase (GNAT) domain
MTSPLPADRLQPVSRLCCYQLDPIQDPRWGSLVEKHPKASVFHTVAWLQALRLTYGYEPVAFTTSPPSGELKNGMVFCRINSWLTGRRLVSLPFSDHCEPLCDADEVDLILRHMKTVLQHQKCKYFEVRALKDNLSQTGDGTGCLPGATYFLHKLDLRPDLDEVFRGLDKESVQRRIRRADRAGLAEKCGRSEDLLKEFYALFVVTRGRHRVPPSPYAWFRNLIQCVGKVAEIRLAYKDETPIAAILTLQFKDVVYYKYGCSDASFNKFGATPWLLWKAIAAAKLNGANEFDMGRTEKDNAGLLAFKNHWVPQPKHLVHWQFPYASSLASVDDWKSKIAKTLFSYMPDRLLTVIGKLIYRHIG